MGKLRHVLTRTALACAFTVSTWSSACVMDGATDGVLSTVPKDTFAVASAINHAVQQGTLQLLPASANRLTMVFWQLEKQLQSHYQGEQFNVYLYELSGNHYMQLKADGETLELIAHNPPTRDELLADTPLIVSDIDVLQALLMKRLSFAALEEHGLYASQGSGQGVNAAKQLLARSFKG